MNFTYYGALHERCVCAPSEGATFERCLRSDNSQNKHADKDQTSNDNRCKQPPVSRASLRILLHRLRRADGCISRSNQDFPITAASPKPPHIHLLVICISSLVPRKKKTGAEMIQRFHSHHSRTACRSPNLQTAASRPTSEKARERNCNIPVSLLMLLFW